jgi:hypothetical protein
MAGGFQVRERVMTKNWSVCGLLAIAGLLFASAALAQRVAVLGGPNTPSWNNDVQIKLVSTGLFPGGVDIIISRRRRLRSRR